MIRHAGLIAHRHDGFWRGALIEGPSGAGKSDLALRCLDRGFRLVADDRTLVWVSGGRLFGRAPETIADLIEVRGHGVLPEVCLPFCEIVLVVRCAAPGEAIERMPEPTAAERLGVRLPMLTLAALEASAPAKLSRALARFDGSLKRRM